MNYLNKRPEAEFTVLQFPPGKMSSQEMRECARERREHKGTFHSGNCSGWKILVNNRKRLFSPLFQHSPLQKVVGIGSANMYQIQNNGWVTYLSISLSLSLSFSLCLSLFLSLSLSLSVFLSLSLSLSFSLSLSLSLFFSLCLSVSLSLLSLPLSGDIPTCPLAG